MAAPVGDPRPSDLTLPLTLEPLLRSSLALRSSQRCSSAFCHLFSLSSTASVCFFAFPLISASTSLRFSRALLAFSLSPSLRRRRRSACSVPTRSAACFFASFSLCSFSTRPLPRRQGSSESSMVLFGRLSLLGVVGGVFPEAYPSRRSRTLDFTLEGDVLNWSVTSKAIPDEVLFSERIVMRSRSSKLVWRVTCTGSSLLGLDTQQNMLA
mmetsp:Transcript_37573/g.98030  ORF Transcript_37573/g.98030 Transcript_37573/m.98030 type:complete len:211 (-) Transcript_37573:51-683(-)